MRFPLNIHSGCLIIFSVGFMTSGPMPSPGIKVISCFTESPFVALVKNLFTEDKGQSLPITK